jgi:hypothetical protein
MDPTDWLPFYPDQLPKRRSLVGPALASQPPHNSAIFPVPDILASLTFLPSYPDRVPHLRVTRERTVVDIAAWAQLAISPLRWLSTYPSQVPHRRFQVARQIAYTGPPLSQAMVVAAALGWLPRYPDRVPHRRLPARGGEARVVTMIVPPIPPPAPSPLLAWLGCYPATVPHRRSLQPAGAPTHIAPLNVISAGICGVTLSLDTCASPALITQVVVASGMVSEGLGSPALIDEDLC